MKIVSKDMKNGIIKVRIEHQEDLWYLSNLIEPGDFVSGKTMRKIKHETEDARTGRVDKRPVFIKLAAEKIEFAEESGMLRVLGKITECPDDVPKASHHTFNVEENSIISIQKERWLKFQLDKLKEASQNIKLKILICVFDREKATFAILKKYGFSILSDMTGNVQKKSVPEKVSSTFYRDISKQIAEYDKRYELDNIILASPAFWKEYLMKELKAFPEVAKKVTLAACNAMGKAGINEVLKRNEVKEVLKQDRTSKEINLVERLLAEISKDGLCAYGLREVKSACEAGAVNILLITDSLISRVREKEAYDQVDSLMKSVDSSKGDILIISSDHEGGKKLDSLGGIGAILRYKIN